MDGHTCPWNGRRVLVTGCTGLLGAAVARELLARGAEVAGLVRDRAGGAEFLREPHAGHFHPVHGRVEDAARLHATMAVHEISAVFHLAATGSAGNDRGTAAVLRAAGLYHPRLPVVVARPVGPFRLAVREEPPPNPLGIARFGELFGGGDRKGYRVVPRTAIALRTGKPAPTPPPGPARDFVFARDAARACLAVAEAVGAGGRPLDLTFRSGWELAEREMAARVNDVFAGRPVGGDADEPPENPFGWRPAGSLAEALRETVEWYRESARGRDLGARPARKAA